jgi:L-aminopeptidase/D-esterase-like protein
VHRLLAAQEWGLAERPVFLTSTMQLGRVYDAACELLIEEQPAIGSDDVIIPIVAECDDSFLNDSRRMQVSADDVRQALAAARASARDAVTGSALDGYFAAVTEATEEAVLNSLLQAVTVTGRDGNTSYQLPARELAALMRQGVA